MFSNYGIIPTDLQPESDEKVVITKEKRIKEPYPGYTIFGNGKETKNGGKSMDILDICKQLNTAEMNLMQFFRDEIEKAKMNGERNPNRINTTKSECWTEYLKIALKKNYKHMKELDILCRESRGVYMMNPRLFIPAKDLAKVIDEWETINATA